MKKTISAALIAAMTITALAFAPAPAQAKVKEIKFHWVTSQFGGPPAMVMKYDGKKWKWSNSGDYHKVSAKMKFKANSKESGWHIWATNMGILYQAPINYKAKKFEDLVAIGFGKQQLKGYAGGAAGVCDTFGSTRKVVRDMSVFTKFSVGGKNASANLPLRIVCMPRGPKRS